MRRHAQGQAGGLAGGQVNAPELHELAHRLLNAEGQIGRWACVYLGDVRSRAVADIGDAETYVDPAVAGCRDVQPGVGEPGVGQAVPEGEQRCHIVLVVPAVALEDAIDRHPGDGAEAGRGTGEERARTRDTWVQRAVPSGGGVGAVRVVAGGMGGVGWECDRQLAAGVGLAEEYVGGRLAALLAWV